MRNAAAGQAAPRAPRAGEPDAQRPLEFIGAFESTYMPKHDVDVLETSDHVRRVQDDLRLMSECGVERLRYPIRWHRVEAEPGRYDWRETDRALAHLRELGLRPIVDLVHHTSYPRWLTRGFADPRFGPSYVRYCAAFAERYPDTAEYTLFNEPFATLFLAGHEGIWPPYGRGMARFVALLRNVLPAVSEASRQVRDRLPYALHIYVDTCEAHSAADEAGVDIASLASDRRFFILDLLLGRPLAADRPFVRQVLAEGGHDLFDVPPVPVDVLGLDYYAHSEWCFTRSGGLAPSPRPLGLAALIAQYADRYRLPLMLSETNIRGTSWDRATWLKHTLDQCEQARAAGAPLTAYCWFPFVDSLDWNSLLAHARGHIDPVGVYWLDENLERRPSSMSRAYAAAVAGAPSSVLPAYRLSEPARAWMPGHVELMAGYSWQEPPVCAGEMPIVDRPVQAASRSVAGVSRSAPARRPGPRRPVPQPLPGGRHRRGDGDAEHFDLVCLSHLRWDFVYQRPQHLMSRCAAERRVLFVEEPVESDGPARMAVSERAEGLAVAVPQLPAGLDAAEREAVVRALLTELVAGRGLDRYVAWLWTPMALPLIHDLRPLAVAYDCMDDLSAFAGASALMRRREAELLRAADVVFTGGRALWEARRGEHPNVHPFPSAVDLDHFAAARTGPEAADQARLPRPRLGFYGVLDERLDIELLEGVATARPDWQIVLVGPVAKIDPATLPTAPNLHYLGPRGYDALPAYLAGWDVALLPFARNEATRYISPTKTPEYLAAGRPVVATSIRDVVRPYGELGLVAIADTVEETVAACEAAMRTGLEPGLRAAVDALLAERSWDATWRQMRTLLTEAVASHARGGTPTALTI